MNKQKWKKETDKLRKLGFGRGADLDVKARKSRVVFQQQSALMTV
jgi:hypothetical protein